MIRSALAVTLLSFVTLASAEAGDAYYEGDDPNPAPLKYPDSTLDATIKQELTKRKVTKAPELAKLTRAEKIALLYTLPTRAGAESDVMVELDGQFTPIEVLWDGDTITLKTGTPRAQLYGKPSSKEELQKKYGIGAFVDDGAAWNDDSLFVVETALATLSPEELAGIAGLPFARLKESANKAARGTVVGLYVPEKQRIELYDFGFEADKRRFMGTIEKPMPKTVSVLVHECGHALSRRGAREARTKIVAAKAELDELNAKLGAERKKYDEERAAHAKSKDPAVTKSLNDRVAGMKQIQGEMVEKKKKFDVLSGEIVAVENKGSPLERALDAKLSFKKAPTTYGRTSVAESFADCLALFKLDRAALERAAPGIPAWFESPEYVALVKAP
jgi:hypothetical protein